MKKNMMKIKKIHQIGIIVGLVCLVSTSVFAVNVSNVGKETTTKQEAKKDEKIKNCTEDDVKKLIGENTESYEDWEKRMQVSSKKLSREKELELYNSGYDFYDIQVAQDLAGLCDKKAEELLEIKGKVQYSTENGNIKDVSKPWDQVVKELNIVIQKPTQELQIPQQQIDEMKAKGLSDADIEEIAILAFNYNKDVHEVLNDISNGKNIQQVKKEYWEKAKDTSKNKAVSTDDAKANTEKVLKKQFNITDEDIQECKKQDIKDIAEIATAKDIANKNNMSIKKVVELKKKVKNWKKVSEEAGGEKGEK